jgi:hypothetical protein
MTTTTPLFSSEANTVSCDSMINPYPRLRVELQRFLSGPLQSHNDAIEAGKATIGNFLGDWAPVGSLMRKVIPLMTHMGQVQARELLGGLGFVASSNEFHTQRQGGAPGAGLQKLDGMEAALIRLGHAGRHVPRDSHDTLWRWNSGPTRIRFTGDPQEDVFAHSVTETDRLHADSCAAIRPICWGSEVFASANAADAYRHGETNTRLLCRSYQALREKITPAFFMSRLRAYLLTYPVGGEMLTGPNAANIGSQVSLDFLTGFGSRDYYDQWASERMKHMTAEESFQVEMTEGEVAAQIVGQNPVVRTSVAAVAAFAKEQIRLSGIHFSLIRSHLIKPMQELTAEQMNGMPVKPNKGTGGNDNGATFGIFQMRHNHPVVSKLIKAVSMLAEGEAHDEEGA